MKKSEVRHCNYMLILYDEMSVFDSPYKNEDGSINENRNVIEVLDINIVLNRLTLFCGIKDCKYYYIYHDKDISEDTGELEQPHYHFIISSSKGLYEEDIVSCVYNNPVKKTYFTLKIDHCAIKNSVLYLCHRSISSKKDKTKYKYLPSDIITNNQEYVDSIYNGVSEDLDNLSLYDFIDNSKGPISLKSLVHYALDNSMYNVLRKSQYLYFRYIEEHNKSC